MKIPSSERFVAERRRFGFRFTCEHCAHFDPDVERCGHFYPTEEHREAHYSEGALAVLVFCKEWELR